MTIVVPVPIPPAGLPLPDPGDRATFSARKLEQLRWANNEYSTGSLALADASYSNALDSQVSATDALASKNAAALSEANAASTANFKGIWSSLTGAIAKPASVSHNGAIWGLLNNLADITTSQPGVAADWAFVSGAFPVQRINSNTTAVPNVTYVIYGACTLTAPAISGNRKQFGIVVLPGVTGAIFAPAGADKTRGASGSQPIDAPFSATLTDSGATDGWV